MSNPTSNFGWQMPTNTDLVTNLPADFEVFGQAVDSDFADLKGGTAGQILSKNSATDLDFVWITNDIGDITAVTATSPLTGGGTTGAITVGIQSGTTSQLGAVQLTDSTSSTSTTTAATPNSVKTSYDLANAAIPKSTVTTSGDVIYATGSSAVTRLGIGSTGQVLTVSGGVPAWVSPAGGGGKVLQVVNVTPSTTFSTTSPSLVDATNYSVSITPTASSSKIFVVFNCFSQVYGSGSNNQYSSFKILRNSTAVYGEGTYCGIALGSSQNIEFASRFGAEFIDSPATTSSITYKIQVKNYSGGTVIVGTPSSLTLFEIGA